MKKYSRKTMISELMKTGYYKLEELDLLQDEVLNDLYLKFLITVGELPLEECQKPYVINYPWRPTRFLEIKKSLYDTYVDANKDNQQGTAVYSFDDGRILKHQEIKELTDAFAKGLMEYGIGINSKVGVMANDAFEEPMSLLSPNALGARVKFLDYFKNPMDIRNEIINGDMDILFIDESFILMEPLINDKGIPVVVLNATRDYSDTKYIPFDKVVAQGASKIDDVLKKHRDEVSKISHDEPALEIKSSGTTGAPKTILHSHSTINSATQKLFFSGFPFGRENFVLKSIPSQLGLGSLTTLYAGLVSGTGVILIRPASKEDAFKQNVQVIQQFKEIREKCGVSELGLLMDFCSPMFVRGIEDEIDKIDDMSFMGAFLAAGAKMNKKELERFNKQNKEKGCTVPITNAYGQNELAGGVTMNTPIYDTPGSAGYPVIGTEVAVVNEETLERVPIGTEGKIIERSSTQFLGYEGMEEATKEAIITLPDGSQWFDTKDTGFVNEDHTFTVIGRALRTINNSDFKMNLDTMENKLLGLDNFKEVAIVPLQTEHDQFPVLFCRLTDEYKDMTPEDVNKAAQMVLGIYEMPVKTIILDRLPSLPSGKIDYKKLEHIINTLNINSGKINYSVLEAAAGLSGEGVPQMPKLELKHNI